MLEMYIKEITDYGIDILFALLMFFVGRKIIGFAVKLLKKSFEKTNLDVSVGKFILSLSRYGLYAILIMIIASQVGINIASFITVLGSAGVAIGLSIQGSLSNFAGGILLLILKPFEVGDYIIGCSVEGKVEMIDLFYTVLLTSDNKQIHVPNGSLANSTVVNVTAQKERRLDLTVGIGYNANIKQAKQVIERILAGHEKILQDKGTTIYVSNLGENSVELGVRVWVEGGDYWTEKWAILEEIKERFDEAGIEIPFNQLDVHLDQK